MNTVYLNGDFIPSDEAKISVMDRGFLFGDGVYEVIPVYNGQLFRLEQHLQRLTYCLNRIHLDVGWSKNQWQQMMQQLVDENGNGNLALYLQVTRGYAEKRLHTFPKKTNPTIFSMVTKLPSPNNIEDIKPCKAICMADIRWKNCDIKSISLLGNVLLAQQAHECDDDEAILINNGIATEGSISNLFIVESGKIITSKKDHRILGGITRELVIELLESHGNTVYQEDIPVARLKKASEIWLTSSTKEIRPVVELDGEKVGEGKAGEVWKQAINIYLEYKQRLYYGR